MQLVMHLDTEVDVIARLSQASAALGQATVLEQTFESSGHSWIGCLRKAIDENAEALRLAELVLVAAPTVANCG